MGEKIRDVREEIKELGELFALQRTLINKIHLIMNPGCYYMYTVSHFRICKKVFTTPPFTGNYFYFFH